MKKLFLMCRSGRPGKSPAPRRRSDPRRQPAGPEVAGAPSPENEDAGPDMRDALLAELEYYLSDKMLPHIKTDKHGLIPLSSLVALSSVRRLCQDEEIIREVIRSSGMIQLSADGAGTFPPHLAPGLAHAYRNGQRSSQDGSRWSPEGMRRRTSRPQGAGWAGACSGRSGRARLAASNPRHRP